MSILQEAEKKPTSLKVKLVLLKSEISSALTVSDPDKKDRGDFQEAKLIAEEKVQEWSSNRHQQNLHRTGEVRVGNAHVIYSRSGVEEATMDRQ